jgi:hypothetical protein
LLYVCVYIHIYIYIYIHLLCLTSDAFATIIEGPTSTERWRCSLVAVIALARSLAQGCSMLCPVLSYKQCVRRYRRGPNHWAPSVL